MKRLISRHPSPFWIVLLAGIIATGLAIAAAGQWARDRTLNELAQQTQNTAQLNTLALRTHLEKFRTIPRVLADDPEVRYTLQHAADTSTIDSLNRKLEQLNRDIAASALYLLGTNGQTIAASNWQEPDSFVGENYQFRPYFQQASQMGQAEYFALGTVSHEPGLYLARRIDNVDGAMLGVVVLKMTFDLLERDWAHLVEPVYVTNAKGVVLISNIPDWRYRTVAPLSPAASQAVQASRQFGDAPLSPLPLATGEAVNATTYLMRTTHALPGIPADSTLLHASRFVEGTTDATLHLLAPIQRQVAQARTNAQLYALLVAGAIATLVTLGYQRRRRAHRRALEQYRRNQELERLVNQRTLQLDQSNRELRAQMDERLHAEARLHQMQDELVQANQLSLLGQVAAGVAHEINQPVAAIRHYADNARAFLQRNDADTAQDNLQNIARLTERIGNITGELRSFSRKRSTGITDIALADALEGALMLTAPRIKRENVQLRYQAPPLTLRVKADPMRLEQVLVNLIQNALDAMAAVTEPVARLDITISSRSDTAVIRVQDNGPGLPTNHHTQLFMPFQTTKPDGLGLGLVISRDLLAEFDGTLQAEQAADARGACFIVTLQRITERTPS